MIKYEDYFMSHPISSLEQSTLNRFSFEGLYDEVIWIES
jgi:hypothetical protein